MPSSSSRLSAPESAGEFCCVSPQKLPNCVSVSDLSAVAGLFTAFVKLALLIKLLSLSSPIPIPNKLVCLTTAPTSQFVKNAVLSPLFTLPLPMLSSRLKPSDDRGEAVLGLGVFLSQLFSLPWGELARVAGTR